MAHVPLFKTELEIMNSEITLDNSDMSDQYSDRNLGSVHYGDRYKRTVTMRLKYRRIHNALDWTDDEATEDPLPANYDDDYWYDYKGASENAAGVSHYYTLPDGTRTYYETGRVSTTNLVGYILNRTTVATSRIEGVMNKIRSDINGFNESIDDNPIYVRAAGIPDDYAGDGPSYQMSKADAYRTISEIQRDEYGNAIPIPPMVAYGNPYFSVEGLRNADPLDALRELRQSIYMEYRQHTSSTSGWRKVGKFVEGAAGVATIAFATYLTLMGSPITAQLMLYAVRTYAVKNGHVKYAEVVGRGSVFVGMVAIAMAVYTFGQDVSQIAGDEVAAEASASAVNTSIESGVAGSGSAYAATAMSPSVIIEAYINAVMTSIVNAASTAIGYVGVGVATGEDVTFSDSARTLVEATIAGPGKNYSDMTTLEIMTKVMEYTDIAFKIYFNLIDPLPKIPTNGNSDSVNPVKGDTIDAKNAYDGGSSVYSIFELPEAIDISYKKLGMEGMCQNTMETYYS